MLENIRIVLVRTFHPGNIGSVARAMKTMGLSDLCLVQPREFPSPEANKMAAGAEDMLAGLAVTDSLFDAVHDCTVVAATSARPRGYDLPNLSPPEAAELLLEHSNTSKVALVFGPERMGLHNDDLKHARYRVQISANPEYGSLNLASAVQILSYEIFAHSNKHVSSVDKAPDAELPTADSIERLHEHLERVLRRIRFLRPHEGETLLRLRNLINRSEPDLIETNILRGILTAVEKNLAQPTED